MADIEQMDSHPPVPRGVLAVVVDGGETFHAVGLVLGY